MKEFYSTSEAASLMGWKDSQSVIEKIKSGDLSAFRMDKNQDYGITRHNLVEFMKFHSIPVPEELDDPEPRIMIVDDKVNFTDSLEEVLNHFGYRVIVANKGVSAGYRLKAFKPHIVLLDMKLGDMDGRDFMKVLYGDEALNHTRIIIISAFVDREDLTEEEASQVHGFLRKPFRYEALLECISDIVSKMDPIELRF